VTLDIVTSHVGKREVRDERSYRYSEDKQPQHDPEQVIGPLLAKQNADAHSNVQSVDSKKEIDRGEEGVSIETAERER
jgi:hypothetical protein